MKSNFSIAALRATAWTAAAFLLPGLAGAAMAPKGVHVTPVVAVQGTTIPNAGAEAALLQQAYGLLATADHDYNGNRIKAMKEIEAAAKILGVSLHGDGKVREAQGASDAQLRSARDLLVKAANGLMGRELLRIERAISHLNIALAIR
jgi:hypothetical protein